MKTRIYRSSISGKQIVDEGKLFIGEFLLISKKDMFMKVVDHGIEG